MGDGNINIIKIFANFSKVFVAICSRMPNFHNSIKHWPNCWEECNTGLDLDCQRRKEEAKNKERKYLILPNLMRIIQ